MSVRPMPLESVAESPDSAVSWGAILAGAFCASAFSLALFALGAGIGLVSVSPWSHANMSVKTFGILAGAWLIAVQLFSSGLGGYLAGRLRTRWTGAHTDEVYFRDTAHGLFVWAVGAVVSFALLALTASSLAGGATELGSAAVKGAGEAATGAIAQTAEGAQPYFVDMLFRTDHPATADGSATQKEIAGVMAKALGDGDLSAPDKTYVAQMVAARTGLNQADAEKRVDDVFAQAKAAKDQAADKAKAAADAARKTGIYFALWAFVSLLVGAVAASYMATVGGKVRDEESARY